jgi:hypothetical protein
MTPGAKSLAIDPTDIWIGVITILRPSGLQRKLLLGGGGGAELLRSGPPLFQQQLPRPVHRIFLAGNHCSARTYVVIISQSTTVFKNLNKMWY